MEGPSQPRSSQRSKRAGSSGSARAIPHRSNPSAAALCAIALARTGFPRARAAALPVLAAGLCALFSLSWVTPRIHVLRTLAQSAGPEFGRLHLLSTVLVGIETLLLLYALWVSPAPSEGR